jgi:hypothetical protein
MSTFNRARPGIRRPRAGLRRHATPTRRAGPGSRHRPRRRSGAAPRVPPRKILLAVALLVAAGLASFLWAQESTTAVARQFVYTAPTANDVALSLPDTVKADLREIGLRHERIAWTRVESTSAINTTVIDMTPRAGNSPNSPVLKVHDRAIQAIDTRISGLEAGMNAAKASTGDHALFAGLTKISFGDAPVTIISSGLDLVAPVDFRALNWTVPSKEIVTNVKEAGELPNLHEAEVTFVVAPTAGTQDQLREAQKTYRNDVWTALLTSSNAASVTFVDATGTDATGTDAASLTPAPPIPIPALPKTPVEPVKDPVNPKKTLCSLPGSIYFRADEPVLIDRSRTVQDLQPCISAALAANATYELDGWTAYVGALAANGAPAIDSPANRALSTARVQAIADLLVSDMKVAPEKITRRTGHGNVDQPYPNPRDPANRLVVISYLIQ